MNSLTSTDTRRADAVLSNPQNGLANSLVPYQEANPDWNFDLNSSGWLSVYRAISGRELRDPLTGHPHWAGPVKMTTHENSLVMRSDLFLPPRFFSFNDPLQDRESDQAVERVLAGLMELTRQWFDLPTRMRGWIPPPSEMLSQWLSKAGLEATLDQEENLRLIIKRPGCDGQIRVTRQEGLLRFSMPLGRWTKLRTPAKEAMMRLASDANTRGRLARIAWITEKGSQRCEAQVDLSGLTWEEKECPAIQAFWEGMICMSVQALDLSLRRLGLELPLLAKHHNLAESFVKFLGKRAKTTQKSKPK